VHSPSKVNSCFNREFSCKARRFATLFCFVQLSIENAAVIKTALQTPLLVDPNGTAREWLSNFASRVAKGGAADTTSMHDPRLATTAELAVRFGKTLVITGADFIHPILVNVLRRDFVSRGSGTVVLVGDKAVDVDEEFRLILVSTNAHLAEGGAAGEGGVAPDVRPLLTIVNFTTTRAGLEAQLLSTTLQHELPQLEQQRMCDPLALQKDSVQWMLSVALQKLWSGTAQSSQDFVLYCGEGRV
jgi:dynein heavy chain 2, cytosolic